MDKKDLTVLILAVALIIVAVKIAITPSCTVDDIATVLQSFEFEIIE